MTSPLVDIYVLANNDPKRTLKCLEHIQRSTMQSFLIHLIDNGSTPPLRPIIESHIQSDKIVYNRSEENEAFCHAMNRWIMGGESEYHLQLNNDCYLEPDCLETMVSVLRERPEVAVVGPKLVDLNNKVWSAGVALRNGEADILYKGYPRYNREVCTHGPIETVCAACVLIRRSVWNAVGGLDGDYVPGAHEDIDVCYRVRENGWCVWYEGSAEAIHEGSVTFSANPQRYVQYQINSQRTLALLKSKWASRLATLPYQTHQTPL